MGNPLGRKGLTTTSSRGHVPIFNPFLPIQHFCGFYSVLRQTILLINGEPLGQQGRPDWPYEPQTVREASQAGSMSEAVNNKVRPDTDDHLESQRTLSIGQTMSFFSGV